MRFIDARWNMVNTSRKRPYSSLKRQHDLCVLVEQLIESIHIGYNVAMNCFKKEAKKSDLGEYYYRILSISVTPTYSPTQTQKDNIQSEKSEEDGEEETKMGDQCQQPRDA